MVDHDGNIIGIAFNINPGPVVISITTIRTCIEMWHQFRYVSFSFSNYCDLYSTWIGKK